MIVLCFTGEYLLAKGVLCKDMLWSMLTYERKLKLFFTENPSCQVDKSLSGFFEMILNIPSLTTRCEYVICSFKPIVGEWSWSSVANPQKCAPAHWIKRLCWLHHQRPFLLPATWSPAGEGSWCLYHHAWCWEPVDLAPSSDSTKESQTGKYCIAFWVLIPFWFALGVSPQA